MNNQCHLQKLPIEKAPVFQQQQGKIKIILLKFFCETFSLRDICH